MPVGPYEDFPTCIAAIMQKEDVDRETAGAICGKMEKGAQRSEKTKQAVMKQRQAQEEGYEDPVIWWSVLDDRTCTVCEALHGDVYEREDAENHFPAHINCRCELYTELTDPDVYGGAEQGWIIPAALTTTIANDLTDIIDDHEESEYNAILPSSIRPTTKRKLKPKARATVGAGIRAGAGANPNLNPKKKSAKLDSLVKSVREDKAKVINTKKPIEVLPLKPEDAPRLFIKTFLIDASISGNAWGVSRKSIVDNIQTFIGKPLVLYKNAKGELDHPPDADAQTIADWNTIQEPFRIGTIIDVVRKEQYNQGPHDDQYFAIIEVTDKDARDVLHGTNQTLYVSPALADLHRNLVANRAGELVGEESDNWVGMHLALVREPAFGIKKAQIVAKCGGSEEACITQLRKARLAKQYCGFCVRSALLGSGSNNGVTSQVTNSATPKALTLSEEDNNIKKEETKTTTTTEEKEKKVEASELEKENHALKQKIAVLETKLHETGELKQQLSARIASLEEREIGRVLEAKVKDADKRREKIRLYVAKGLSASDVEDIYRDIPGADQSFTTKKARLDQAGGRATLGQTEQEDEEKENARKLINGGMF